MSTAESTQNGVVPAEAWVVALLTLPGVGPSRLRQLLDQHGAEGSWTRLCSGKSIAVESVSRELVEQWRSAARRMSVADHWAAIRSLGVDVFAHGSEHYPARLVDDIEPPQVLFSLGHPLPDGPMVAIVGTRKCTAYGQRCAFELGAALVEAGVSVVSGLALGIDAAAHRGALGAGSNSPAMAIGVVGSGLDVIYPKQNAALWSAVASKGVLLSETPPGVRPDTWRFPARNRLIAGLADAVIVVESHERGGSLITVDEAQDRDRPVGAVPGPITSNAAAGSNRLLVDGATPILDVGDILAMIGYSPTNQRVADGCDPQNDLLDALGWAPMSFDELCSTLDVPAQDVAVDLERLVAEGRCAHSGMWIERIR